MYLNPNFELASLCIMALLLVLTHRKPLLPTRTNQRFRMICRLSFTLNLLDLLSVAFVVGGHPLPTVFTYGVLLFYYILQPLLYALVADYCAHAARLPQPYLRAVQFFSRAVTGVAVLLGAASPWLGFYYDLRGDSFAFGPLFWVLTAQMLLLLGVSLAAVVAGRRQLSPRCFGSLLAMLGLMFVASFAQCTLVTNTLMVYFFVSLGLMCACYWAQNADYYLHAATGVFNHRGLDELLQECYHRGLHYTMVCLRTSLPGDRRYVFTTDFELRIFSSAAQKLLAAAPGTSVFFLSRPRSFILISFAPAETVNCQLQQAVAQLQTGWLLDGHQVALEATALVFDGPACAASLEEARILAENAFYMEDLPHVPNGVLWASNELVARLNRMIRVHKAVRRAVRENDVAVVFQPIVDLAGNLRAAEALARLNDPELGPLSPLEFVDAAETSGAILQLGQSVFETTLRIMADHWGLFNQLDYVSVNLSPLQLSQPDLAQRYLALAEAYQVPLSYLAFEITESRHLAGGETTHHTLTALRRAGARIILDDFGSGFCGINRLLSLPETDLVKLDRALVQCCLDQNERLLADLIRLIHGAGLRTVAEGVEDEAQFHRLIALGVDGMQGFYFSRPLDVQALHRYALRVS